MIFEIPHVEEPEVQEEAEVVAEPSQEENE